MNFRFVPLAIPFLMSLPAAADPAPRARHALEQFDTVSLSISRVVFPTNGDTVFAYVQSPDGLIHRVGVGDYVGNPRRRVTELSRCGIFFDHSERDFNMARPDSADWMATGACGDATIHVAEIQGSERSAKLELPQTISGEKELLGRRSERSAIVHVAKKDSFLFAVENRPFGMMPHDFVYVYRKEEGDDIYTLQAFLPTQVTHLKFKVDGHCFKLANGDNETFASACVGWNQRLIKSLQPVFEVE